jgi:hypothetical protein
VGYQVVDGVRDAVGSHSCIVAWEREAWGSGCS